MRVLITFLSFSVLFAFSACRSPQNDQANQPPAANELRLSVTTVPLEPRMDKPFTVRVHLLDSSGGPVTGAKVAAALSMKEMDHGRTEFEFTEKGHGVYEGISKVEMSGAWNLKLTAERGPSKVEQDIPLTVAD